MWLLSKCGCLLWQCSVRATRCPSGREGCRGRRKLEMHKASGRASRSSFSDSPRNQWRKGERREWRWEDALLLSDWSSPVWIGLSFHSYKTQKRTKREIWQIELPTSLKKSPPPPSKKNQKPTIGFGFFSFWKYQNGARIFIFVLFQVALSFLLVRGTDKNSFISLLLFSLRRDDGKTEKYENRWVLASHAGSFFLFSNW